MNLNQTSPPIAWPLAQHRGGRTLKAACFTGVLSANRQGQLKRRTKKMFHQLLSSAGARLNLLPRMSRPNFVLPNAFLRESRRQNYPILAKACPPTGVQRS